MTSAIQETPVRKRMNGKPVFSVPSKTVINFASGFKKKLLCDGPTFSAGTACVYKCSFCYVPDAMRKQKKFLTTHGVEGAHEDVVIRRSNAVEIAELQLLKAPMEMRRKPLVIYASPLVDVAGNMEMVRETVEICKVILKHTNWQIRLLSKSNLLPKVAAGFEGEYVPESRKRIIYGVSTGTLDDKLAASFEEDCPLVSKRIQSLHWLQDNGFRTFGMICPSLPQLQYNQFSEDMRDALRADQCEHVWAEVINVRGESFARTYKALWDAGYRIEAWRLKQVSDDKEKWENYARLTFLAHSMVYPSGKLRFLQYTTNATEAFWKEHEGKGAVLL